MSSHYSDHNKRKRLSASARSASPASAGGGDGDQFDADDDYYRSLEPRFSDAASCHSHHSQRSFVSAGSHHSYSLQQHLRGHSGNYRGGGGGGGGFAPGDVGDGNSTIATINSADLVSLKRDREREGRCSECGAQTHELKVDPRTGARTKEPLNVEGEVRRGRCVHIYIPACMQADMLDKCKPCTCRCMC
jgi:hypothetical protein